MPILRIRDVPDDVYEVLVAAARAEQRSLSQQVIVELRRALAIGSDEARAAVVQRLRVSGRRLTKLVATPEALQREARDAL